MMPLTMVPRACAVTSYCYKSDLGNHCCHYCTFYSLGCPDDIIACNDTIICMYTRNNLRMTRWIFIKFGIDIMPLVPSLKLYFLYPSVDNINITDCQIHEVGG
jgi:hypothetical protein